MRVAFRQKARLRKGSLTSSTTSAAAPRGRGKNRARCALSLHEGRAFPSPKVADDRREGEVFVKIARIGSLAPFAVVLLAAGCSSPAPSPEGPSGVWNDGEPAAADRLTEWRRIVSTEAAPKAGCFSVTHPSTTWAEVPCGEASRAPMLSSRAPARPPGAPSKVHTTISSSVNAGTTINWAEGSFPLVSGVYQEWGSAGSAGVYSLQLNVDGFSTPGCHDSHNTNCSGWQQFIYASEGRVLIEYWLLGWLTGATDNNPCPSIGGHQFSPWGNDCVVDSDVPMAVPSEPISDLRNMSVTGSSINGYDTINVSLGDGVLYRLSQPSVLRLDEGAWNTVQFNVFGDYDGTGAEFNPGTRIVAQTLVNGPAPATPTCVDAFFTAEWSNLTPISCLPTTIDNYAGIQVTEIVPQTCGSRGESCCQFGARCNSGLTCKPVGQNVGGHTITEFLCE
jgi:hypothetical protein